MNAKMNAIAMTLLMIASALAGCASSDGVEELSDDDMQEIIEYLNATQTQWINDRGDSSELWEFSLEDNQWLEVKSAMTVMNYESQTIFHNSFVVSEEGFAVSGGYSPIFGGDYSWCTMNYGSEIPCANEDPDGDWAIEEWSIIYAIHEINS